MGGSKRMMEEEDHKRQVATQIALEAGALKTCDVHEDWIYEGDQEIESAYRLGNSKYSAGKLEGVFKNPKEMTDYIKDVVENYPSEICPSCSKQERD